MWAISASSCVATAVKPPAARERSISRCVRGVDVLLLGVGDGGRLEVGALDEAEVGRQVEERLEVGGRAVEVRLQDGADVLVTVLAQRPVHPERRIDEGRLLHVEPDEVPARGGVGDELADVGLRELLVEGEPEVRELERDVDPQLLGRDAVEDLPVGVDDDAGLGLAADALAEQRRVGAKPFSLSRRSDDDRLVERLAGHEPARARVACRAGARPAAGEGSRPRRGSPSSAPSAFPRPGRRDSVGTGVRVTAAALYARRQPDASVHRRRERTRRSLRE